MPPVLGLLQSALTCLKNPCVQTLPNILCMLSVVSLVRAPGRNAPLIRFLILALYIVCLFISLVFFLHFLLLSSLTYLPLRIDHFQAGFRKRQLNLALVFSSLFCVVVHFF